MSKLCISLPPFAPDYSGAASAVFDMDGLVVLHDASGCTGNYLGYDEPRWFDSQKMVYCSGLRHMDAVLGNDAKLVERIQKAAASLNPKFITVIGSPVPMVIGTDFKGLAQEIEETTGIASIGIDSKGLEYYNRGIYDAVVEILKKFAPLRKETEKGSINILGMTPLDFSIEREEEDFNKLFASSGIEVVSCYCFGLSVEKLQSSLEAELNVAVSQVGVDIAKYMKKKYGIPYIVAVPIGDGQEALRKVQNCLEKKEIESCIPNTLEARTLIIGDQIIGNAIREYLQKYLNYGAIDVATPFEATKEYQWGNDTVVKNEAEMKRLVNNGKYKTIIADPLIRQLIKDEAVRFYDFTHVAVSGRVYWDRCRKLLGSDMENWLKTIREE